MQCEWLGERVAAPDVKTVVRNTILNKVAGNWGPNTTFRFPSRNGTGGIWKSVASLLPQKKMRFGKRGQVTQIDVERKLATFADGSVVQYENLITSMPLDAFTKIIGNDRLHKLSKKLFFSHTNVIGIGIRGERPARIGDKCWVRTFIHYLDYSPTTY